MLVANRRKSGIDSPEPLVNGVGHALIVFVGKKKTPDREPIRG